MLVVIFRERVILQLSEVSQSGGQSSLLTWGLLIVMAIATVVLMRRSGNKRMEQVRQQQEQLKSSLQPGTWVRTTSGFFGRVVEVTGEVVTLANLTGEETLWDLRVIAEVKEPNFGTASENSDLEGEESGSAPDDDDSLGAAPHDTATAGEADDPDDTSSKQD